MVLSPVLVAQTLTHAVTPSRPSAFPSISSPAICNCARDAAFTRATGPTDGSAERTREFEAAPTATAVRPALAPATYRCGH